MGHPRQHRESAGHGTPGAGKNVRQIFPLFHKAPVWERTYQCLFISQVPWHIRLHVRRLSSSYGISNGTSQNLLQPLETHSTLHAPDNSTKAPSISISGCQYTPIWNGGPFHQRLFHEKNGVSSKQAPTGPSQTPGILVPRYKLRSQRNDWCLLHTSLHHKKTITTLQKNDRQANGTPGGLCSPLGQTHHLLQKTNCHTVDQAIVQRYCDFLSSPQHASSKQRTSRNGQMDVPVLKKSDQTVYIHPIFRGPQNQTGPSTSTSSSTKVPYVFIRDEQIKSTYNALSHSTQIQKHCVKSHQRPAVSSLPEAVSKHQIRSDSLLQKMHVPSPGTTHPNTSHPRTTTPDAQSGSNTVHAPPIFHTQTTQRLNSSSRIQTSNCSDHTDTMTGAATKDFDFGLSQAPRAYMGGPTGFQCGLAGDLPGPSKPYLGALPEPHPVPLPTHKLLQIPSIPAGPHGPQQSCPERALRPDT